MVLLMGSKEEDVPSEPAVKPVFMEDMNESELASAVSVTTFVKSHSYVFKNKNVRNWKTDEN